MRELNRDNCRLSLQDNGFSLRDLVDFGIKNVTNVSCTALYQSVLFQQFPNKSLTDIISLYELIKNPFNLKW
jgi:hypothetical protein